MKKLYYLDGVIKCLWYVFACLRDSLVKADTVHVQQNKKYVFDKGVKGKLSFVCLTVASLILTLVFHAQAQVVAVNGIRIVEAPNPAVYCFNSDIKVVIKSSKQGRTSFFVYVVDGNGPNANVLERIGVSTDIRAHNQAGAESTPYTLRLSSASVGRGRYLRAIAQQGDDIAPVYTSLSFAVIGAPVSGGNKTITYGDAAQILTAKAYEGQTINWYDAATGGNLVSNATNTTEVYDAATKTVTSSFNPGVTAANVKPYTYYAQAVNVTFTQCATTVRTPITLTINPKPISVIGALAKDRDYNGTDIATLDNVGSLNESEKIGSDDVMLNSAVTPTAIFSDRHASSVAKTVTITGYALTGSSASNYVVSPSTITTAFIRPLGITGGFTAKDKPFDGDVAAEVLTRFLFDTYSIDEVSLSGGTAEFDTPIQGVDKTVTLTGATLAGANAGNYNLTSVATTLASITAPTPLPVTLVSFEGSRSGNVVKLAWATASEKDNDYFEVQQSEDGKSFKVMGEKVKGAGTTAVAQSYKAIIAANSSNTLYYRLKQVDFDGKFEYSKVIAVEADGKATAKASMQAYPNPTPGKVMVSTEGSGPATVTLFHSSGRAVSQQQVQIANGQPISMDLTGQTAGVYYLQVQTGTSKSTTRLVKQ
ncbi:YDG domain-containing protein [Rufibacter sediminis]|uniref:T9SS type A sorting domain-containing protein n=1 Tax=Rufibacter sediminis TaxID=2762756 RepID=A0ABR6VUR9_9BACT|nr:YDG domain-containing protein [Rufibacter sediminis]MBC3540963.1 T9SS type A sorting domain-containing protein [Rufibacter sediminis]